MKLILSTFALGTAAATPFIQGEQPAAQAPQPEPLRLATANLAQEPLLLVQAQQDDEELREAAAALEAQLADLKAQLEAMRGELAQKKGDDKKEGADKEERSVKRLRRSVAKLEERREKAEKRRAEAMERREEAEARRAEAMERAEEARARGREARDRALEARGRAMELSGRARREGRAQAEEAQQRARVLLGETLAEAKEGKTTRRRVIAKVLGKDGEVQESVLEMNGDGDKPQIIHLDGSAMVELDGDAGEWIAKLKDGDEEAMQWIFEAEGPKGGIAKRWVTKTEGGHHDGDHEVRVFTSRKGLPGMKGGQNGGVHVMHGMPGMGIHGLDMMGGHGGQTINITVEEGDVHINANGATIHTQKGQSGASGFYFDTKSKGKQKSKAKDPKAKAKGLFGAWKGAEDMNGGQGSVFFAKPEIAGKVIINGEEMEFNEEMLEELELGDGGAFSFSFGGDGFTFDGECENEFTFTDVDELPEGLEALIDGELDGIGFSNLGVQVFTDLEDLPEGLEDIEELIEGKLEGLDFDDFDVDVDFDFDGDSPFDAAELEALIEGAVDGAMRNVHVIKSGDGNVMSTKIIVNGEEIFSSDDECCGECDEECSEECTEECTEECEEEECSEECEEEESQQDGRFVMAWPHAQPPSAKAPAVPAWPAVPTGVRYQLAGSAPADEDLVALAREIRAELSAMRAELAELRAQVMGAPAAQAPAAPKARDYPGAAPTPPVPAVRTYRRR